MMAPVHARSRSAAALLMLLLAAAQTSAQPADGIIWYTIDCGGSVSTGGPFTLVGTIGQPDAGPPLSGGGYTLLGGFWPGIATCAADWNGDGFINSSDISAFLTAWLQSVQDGTLAADFNGDGQANSSDISAFLTAWLQAVTNGC
jgi:hypothetical protein